MTQKTLKWLTIGMGTVALVLLIKAAILTANDVLTNVDLCCKITWIAADGDTLQVWTGEFMVSKRGAHELLFDSKDIGKIKVRTIRVDDKDNSWIKDSAVGYITIH